MIHFFLQIIIVTVNKGFLLWHFEQERAEQRKLKAHEKTTYTQKIKNRTRTISKIEITDEEEDKLPAVEDDPTRTAAIIHGQNKCIS